MHRRGLITKLVDSIPKAQIESALEQIRGYKPEEKTFLSIVPQFLLSIASNVTWCEFIGLVAASGMGGNVAASGMGGKHINGTKRVEDDNAKRFPTTMYFYSESSKFGVDVDYTGALRVSRRYSDWTFSCELFRTFDPFEAFRRIVAEVGYKLSPDTTASIQSLETAELARAVEYAAGQLSSLLVARLPARAGFQRDYSFSKLDKGKQMVLYKFEHDLPLSVIFNVKDLQLTVHQRVTAIHQDDIWADVSCDELVVLVASKLEARQAKVAVSPLPPLPQVPFSPLAAVAVAVPVAAEVKAPSSASSSNKPAVVDLTDGPSMPPPPPYTAAVAESSSSASSSADPERAAKRKLDAEKDDAELARMIEENERGLEEEIRKSVDKQTDEFRHALRKAIRKAEKRGVDPPSDASPIEPDSD